jgi:hypothetical protein
MSKYVRMIFIGKVKTHRSLKVINIRDVISVRQTTQSGKAKVL